jgi:protein O-mannosyl-transferase
MIGTQERNNVWATEESLWKDTVAKNPTSGRALNNLSLVHMGRGNYEAALDLLAKCEQYWTSYLYCSLNRGIASQALKKNDEAEKAYMRAYALNPKNVHVNFHLGKFFQDVKKNDAKAAEYFRTSVELTGGRYPAGDINLALALTNIKRYDEARAALIRALSVEKDNTVALFNLARIESEVGNDKAAGQLYERITGIQPSHVQAWYNLGVIRLHEKRLEDARKAFETTVAIDPKSEQGWYNLAFTAESLRDMKKAVEAVRKLASIDPSKTEYKTRLESLEKRVSQ